MTQKAIDGEYIYFVTANVQNRRWYFVTPGRAETLGQAIQTCCRIKHFDLLAYCILPNHIHLLVRKLRADEVLGQEEAQRKLESLRCEEGVFGAHEYIFPHRRLSSRNEAQRKLESMRCEANRSVAKEGGSPQAGDFLFPHRRLESRRWRKATGYTIGDLMQSIKGTFSRTLPKGKFWQHRSYFRIVQTEDYLNNLVAYIRGNYHKMN